MMKKCENIAATIKRKMKSKQFNTTPLGRRLLGIAMMHVPKLGLESAEKIIPLINASFLADCGLKTSLLKKFATTSPSASTLKALMIDEANDTISTGTDAGGGRTREDLVAKLKTFSRMKEGTNEHISSTCSLHSLNL